MHVLGMGIFAGYRISVEISNVAEYLSHSEILPIFTKRKNRVNLAALLVEKLVDE